MSWQWRWPTTWRGRSCGGAQSLLSSSSATLRWVAGRQRGCSWAAERGVRVSRGACSVAAVPDASLAPSSTDPRRLPSRLRRHCSYVHVLPRCPPISPRLTTCTPRACACCAPSCRASCVYWACASPTFSRLGSARPGSCRSKRCWRGASAAFNRASRSSRRRVASTASLRRLTAAPARPPAGMRRQARRVTCCAAARC